MRGLLKKSWLLDKGLIAIQVIFDIIVSVSFLCAQNGITDNGFTQHDAIVMCCFAGLCSVLVLNIISEANDADGWERYSSMALPYCKKDFMSARCIIALCCTLFCAMLFTVKWLVIAFIFGDFSLSSFLPAFTLLISYSFLSLSGELIISLMKKSKKRSVIRDLLLIPLVGSFMLSFDLCYTWIAILFAISCAVLFFLWYLCAKALDKAAKGK